METNILDRYSSAIKMKEKHEEWKNEIREGRYNFLVVRVLGGEIELKYHYGSRGGSSFSEDKINKLEFSMQSLNKLDSFIKNLIQEEVDSQLTTAKRDFQETLIKQLD